MKTPLFFAFCLIAVSSFAQGDWNRIGTAGIISKDSVKKNGYTILFINKDRRFSTVTKERMIDTYFKVYPKEAKRFNKKTREMVTFIIDPDFEGVAAAGDGIIRVNPKWMADHPQDLDVVTHECMHIVQSYPSDAGPGWLTEGIADYARYAFGVNNEAANWSLPKFDAAQHYTKSYRITARFLVWTEKNFNKNLVNKLDDAMRKKNYKPETWKELTGKMLDELWEEYTKNPVI